MKSSDREPERQPSTAQYRPVQLSTTKKSPVHPETDKCLRSYLSMRFQKVKLGETRS